MVLHLVHLLAGNGEPREEGSYSIGSRAGRAWPVAEYEGRRLDGPKGTYCRHVRKEVDWRRNLTKGLAVEKGFFEAEGLDIAGHRQEHQA